MPQMEMAPQPSAILKIFFFSLFSFTLILIYLLLYRRHVSELEFRQVTQAGELSDV